MVSGENHLYSSLFRSSSKKWQVWLDPSAKWGPIKSPLSGFFFPKKWFIGLFCRRSESVIMTVQTQLFSSAYIKQLGICIAYIH